MNNQEKSTRPTFHQFLQKTMDFCVYQERSHQEVRNKLSKWHVDEEIAEEIITELIRENFLNEERFATQFARGKFHQNKWGKHKIKQALKYREVSNYCIEKALNSIAPEEYTATLKKLLINKSKSIKTANPLQKKQKLMNYVLQKGYEKEVIENTLQEIADDDVT